MTMVLGSDLSSLNPLKSRFKSGFFYVFNIH